MKRLFEFLVIGFCLVCALPALSQTASTPVAKSESWPLVRGDALASGVAHSKLPDNPQVVWKHTLNDSGFEATAILAGGKVFVGDFDGTFHALALKDGKPLWKQVFKDSGFTQAAAYAEGRLVVSDFDGMVRCLNAEDGKTLWSYEASSESYAAPNIHDGKVLLSLEAGELLALDLETGKLLWNFRIEAPLRCWPTVVENKVLLAGCDQRFHVVDINSGMESAGVDIDAQTGSTPAVLDGHVLFGTEQGTFYSISAKTMQIRWQYRNPKQGQPIRASASVDKRSVIFPNQGKQVTALNPINGEKLWTFTVRSTVESSPVIAGDQAFLSTKRGRLYGVDVTSGKETWQYQAGGSFLASPAIAQGKLVIGNEDGTLYCFGGE